MVPLYSQRLRYSTYVHRPGDWPPHFTTSAIMTIPCAWCALHPSTRHGLALLVCCLLLIPGAQAQKFGGGPGDGFGAGTVAVGATLPVSLLSFTATPSNNAVVLNWRTATEQNNAGFWLERSTGMPSPGKELEFQSIAWLPGAGTASQEQRYRFTDHTPALGWVYYRLRQRDVDGTETIHPRIVVELKPLSTLELWPNPAGEMVTLSLGAFEGQAVEVVAVNAAGVAVLNKVLQVPATGLVALDLRDLPGGIYSLRVLAGAGSASTMLVVD